MNLNFQAAIAYLRSTAGGNFASDLANGARPDAAYVFTNDVLPIREVASYFVQAAGTIIRATMTGLVGMDSLGGPIGAVEMNTFLANTAKFGGHAHFNEATLRELQNAAQNVFNTGGDTVQFAVDNVLNFVQKLLIQPQLDTLEYLAVRACMTGALDWTFNQKRLQVNYGVPAGNLFAQRTLLASYVKGVTNTGANSVFWDDWRSARSILGGPFTAFATPETIDGIISNPANNIFLTAQDEFGSVSFDRIVNTSTDRRSEDQRNNGRIIAYDQSGNVFDLVNRGQTVEVPFLSDGYIICIGRPRRQEFGIISNRGDEEPRGGGATGLMNGPTIGYTHLGPSVERGGQTGIFNNVYVTDLMPMQLQGDTLMNALPLILQPTRLVVLRTTMT